MPPVLDEAVLLTTVQFVKTPLTPSTLMAPPNAAEFAMKMLFVTTGVPDVSVARPPPLEALLLLNVQLMKTADDPAVTNAPPPRDEAELPVMMQFRMVGLHPSSRSSPPPEFSGNDELALPP